MPDYVIQQSTWDFLKRLSRNNNRDWFAANKLRYQEAQANAVGFFEALIDTMNTHDRLEPIPGKKALYRIYNDVRFSNDQTPYNPRFAGRLRRVKPMLRGGYYLWLKPGASRIGCGFTYPNPEDLLRIRLDIDRNYSDWKKLLKTKSITKYFGEIPPRSSGN